jgi:riboflavin synthase
MFTGIIRNTGTVKILEDKKGLKVIGFQSALSSRLKKGGSIAVDGCCLTVTSCTKNSFKAEVMAETLKKTVIGKYKKGSAVNLEMPLKLGESLDGHLVQGHVDFSGTVKSVKKNGESREIEITFPKDLSKYFALKGSVTVNGVSLTVSMLNAESFEVSLIPQTIKSTNLGMLKKGDFVNIEVDLIGRYLESLVHNREKTTSYQFLKARGFI